MISPPKAPNGEAPNPAVIRLRLHAQLGEDQLGEAVGLFQVRVAAEDEGVDPEILVLAHPFGDGIRVSDQRRARLRRAPDPTPAQRFGLISRLSREPLWSAFMRD